MSCIRLQKKTFHFFVGFHGCGAEFRLVIVSSVQQHAIRHTQYSEPVAVRNLSIVRSMCACVALIALPGGAYVVTHDLAENDQVIFGPARLVVVCGRYRTSEAMRVEGPAEELLGHQIHTTVEIVTRSRAASFHKHIIVLLCNATSSGWSQQSWPDVLKVVSEYNA